MTTPNQNTALVPKEDKAIVEFKPFGSEDSIKLTVSIVKNLIAIPTKSGKLPSDNECMKFMMLCRSRALNPFESDAYLQGYDGKDGPQFSLITAHQAFLKRAEVHPEFDGFESGVIVLDKEGAMIDRIGDFTHKDDELLGGWCTVHFKGRKFPMKKRLKLSTFNQGFGRWQKDAAGMIVKCAEADGLRSSFPTKIGGMYLREECDMVNDDDKRFQTARPARVASVATVHADPIPAVVVAEPLTNEGSDSEGDLGPEAKVTAEAVKSPEPVKEKAAPAKEAAKPTAKPVTKPVAAAAAPAADVVDEVVTKLQTSDIPEASFSLWVCDRYHLAKVESIAEINEVAPNRVRNVNDSFAKLVLEYQAVHANN